MVALTPAAAAEIRALVASAGLEPAGGLRLALDTPGNGTEPEFSLAVAPTPAEGDGVVERDGARLFVDPAAAAYFEDKVLDAEGGTFTFAPEK